MGTTFAERLVERTSGAFGPRFTRRRFLIGSAMIGSAMIVSGCQLPFKKGTPFQHITDCPDGSPCRDGYTEFCCTINGGVNACPPGSFPAGWWRADFSSFCNGTRYYIDCNQECCGPAFGGFCQGCVDCTCGPSCANRRIYCNYFRYGQCHQEVGITGPIACRVATCAPPWEFDPTCAPSSAVDNATAEHISPCLLPQPPPPPPPPPPAVLPSIGAAVAPTSGSISVFVRGSGGDLLYRDLPPGSSTWNGYGSQGGSITSAVKAVVIGGNTFVVSRQSDNAMWILARASDGTWSQGSPLGGSLTSDPALVPFPSNIYVFARGTDNAIWYRTITTGWSSLGGILTSDPAAVAYGSTPLVFARGVGNGMFYRGLGGDWVGLGGTFTSDPAVVSDPSGLYFFARGTDGAMWYRRSPDGVNWDGGVSIGGNWSSDPVAVSDPLGLYVVGRGTDGAMWYRRYNRSLASWEPGVSIGGNWSSDPAVVSDPPYLYVFGLGSDNALWYRRTPDGTNWEPGVSLGGSLNPVRGAN